jgi:hypothetical protein
MFENVHFYHRTIRRCVVAFGNLFNQITLIKYAKGTFDEIERITVPISYSANENYAQRILGNPDIPTAVQIKLPRMSFEMIGINYDPSRKLSSLGEECATVNGERLTVPSPSPYNIQFELNIYVRNIEDGTQIIEQILPYFNPDYTLAMKYVDEMSIVKNTPIILEEITNTNGFEGDNETVRYVNWRLTFTMKTYLYGPVSSPRSLIRHVIANTYIMGADTANNTPAVTITVDPDPLNAGPDDAYGYDTQIIEYN